MDCVVLGSWYSYDQDGDNVNEVGTDDSLVPMVAMMRTKVGG